MSDELFTADIEEFTSEPEEAPQHSPAELKALIEDLNKQIAGTMDELEQRRLRNARKVLEEQLGVAQQAAPANHKTEGQWTELSKAYAEFYGKKNPWRSKFEEYGGLCDAAYDRLTAELSEAHKAKEAAKAKKGAKGKKDESEPTPQERFNAAILHAKNLSLDGQVIFDELGGGEITGESVDRLLSEINTRAENALNADNATEEEFTADDAVSAPTTYFSDAAIQGIINTESGEVEGRNWLLDKLGWTEFPTELSKEHADRIVDVLHTSYLDPAARYRQQAERLAAPLEKRAEQILAVVGAYLDACGNKFLPRFQKGARVGEFSKKTLDLPSGSISWRKDGGAPALTNHAEHFQWQKEQEERLFILREQNTPEALAEMAQLKEKYGARLETHAVFDKDKLAKAMAPGYSDIPANEFAGRTIK